MAATIGTPIMDRWITIEDAADVLSVSQNTIRNLLNAGALDHKRIKVDERTRAIIRISVNSLNELGKVPIAKH